MNTGNHTDITDGPRERRLTVLLVEDHADTREVLSKLLASRGYRVLVAGGWAEAVELGAFDTPDVLVADAQLPDGSGWDLLPLLRERHPRLAGIALTAHGYPRHVQRSRAAGFCRHLTKPISAQQLCDAIADCAARRAA